MPAVISDGSGTSARHSGVHPRCCPISPSRSKASQAGGAAIFTGYIDIPESGVYVFGTDADRLEIDSEEVVNNDGKLAMYQLAAGPGRWKRGATPSG